MGRALRSRSGPSTQGRRGPAALGALAALAAAAQLVAACGSVGPVPLRNAATGERAAACGPLMGLKSAVKQAQQGCVEGYTAKGWEPGTAVQSRN
jgi:hypothetical protein